MGGGKPCAANLKTTVGFEWSYVRVIDCPKAVGRRDDAVTQYTGPAEGSGHGRKAARWGSIVLNHRLVKNKTLKTTHEKTKRKRRFCYL